MIKAIAPSHARGLRKLTLAIATALAWPLALCAQPGGGQPPNRPAPKAEPGKAEPGKNAAAPAPAPPPDADGDGKPDEPEPPPPPKGMKEISEVFRDKMTDEVLKNTKGFKGLKESAAPPSDAIRKMAQNLVAIDAAQLDQFVKSYTSAMATDKVIRNLAARAPGENPKPADVARALHDNQLGVEAVEKAFTELLEPILQAEKANNAAFLSAYAKLLVKYVTPLLSNHLYARVEGMILLAKTADPAVVRTLVDQIKDPKQVVMVKLQAAHGITMVMQGGRRRLAAPSDEIDAARAIDNFLNNQPDAIWPARYRAVEALGALRQPSINAALNDFKMVETASKILADPQARPEVRANAAWALGMIRVEAANPKVADYRAIAADVGRLAVELGDKILKVRSGKGNLQAADLTALLAYPIYNSLKGEPGVIKSGLLNSGALGQARPFVTELEQLVKAVAASAVELEQSPLALIGKPRKELADNVEALRKFLDADGKPAGNGNGVAAGAGGPNPK